MDNGSDFFLSYASEDEAWAEWIAWQLHDAGYSLRLQAWDFIPGTNFITQMETALTQADRIIAVVSPAYARSTAMMSEASTAVQQSRLIPVLVRTAETLPAFTGMTWVDLAAVDDAGTARERLLRAVQGGRRRSRGAPAFPGSSAVQDVDHGPRFPQGDQPPAGLGGENDKPAPVPRALVVHASGDGSFAAELADSLQVLTAEGVLSGIDLHPVQRQYEAAQESRVATRVREAEIVLLLVSRELLSTEYGSSREMGVLLRRHEDRQAALLPVLVRAASWERQSFGRLSPLPADGLPVSQWASRDEAIKSIIDGTRFAAGGLRGDGSGPEIVDRSRLAGPGASRELGEVFKPAGVPTLTFVEPDDFVEFRLALRQPGLGIVLEGPSGIGKTTMLRHAVEQDAARLGPIRILSARKPAHVAEIIRLPDGHEGIVAVDDFHRLPAEVRDRLADYLKLLADDDGAQGKLVIVGIPGTAMSLVTVGSDVATRVRVFRLGRATESLILQMVEKGEAALNIRFDGRAEVCRAAMGSLLTAQMLCWHLVTMNGIERTVETLATVHTDIGRARVKVTESLGLKYQPMVEEFIVLDATTEPLCIELLLRLAKAADGILRLKTVREERPDLNSAIERVFVNGMRDGFGPSRARIVEHLFYDPRGQRLISDDPQFMFYLQHLNRDELLVTAGKLLPAPRDQVFVCYSHKDAEWLDRLQVHLGPLERNRVIDLWSDRRIELGDVWRKEIAAALSRARAALLLVSADFLDSDFIRDHELPPLLKAAEDSGCRIIPILVAPSLFEQQPTLARFQHANPGGTTLVEMTSERRERFLADLAGSLSQLLQRPH
ncbi:TIR domain-containing protein [Parafrankia sp. FMc6]|uniref:TIR domain-containing protein n=1 Tax=Parafrankia soli TaxID=2599596 RepID=UPI0034D63526